MFLLAGAVQAQVPSVINYQGRLADDNEASDGAFDITFSLYDVAEGGTALWTETQTVHVTNGLFNVLLGSVESLPTSVFDGSVDRFLSLQVAGDAEMAPRFRLTSVPYALRAAGVAEGAVDSVALAEGAVTSTALADGAVTGNALADRSVRSNAIADGAVTNGALAEGAVTSTALADGAVTRDALADGAVSADVLADGAVTAAKVADGALVKSVNGLTDAVTLVEGTNISITQEENSLTIAGAADAGNTLDQAYDQGGAGAGRMIDADNGAVHVAGSGGLTVDGPTDLGETTINEELLHKGSILRHEGSELRLGTNDERDVGERTDQRALVHGVDDALAINFEGDFEGGTVFVAPDGATNFFVSGETGGNVGVGTSSPASKLEVAGPIHSTVGGFLFPDGTIQTTALADDAVTSEMIADDAVTREAIADDAVHSEAIADDAVRSEAIADGHVNTVDLADGSVDRSKIVDEPGFNYTNNGQPNTLIDLDGTGESVASVTLDAPADGIAVVRANTSVSVGHQIGEWENVVVKLSRTAGDVFATSSFGVGVVRIPPEWPSTSVNFVTTLPVFQIFTVTAGENTFHLNAHDSQDTGRARLLKPEIIAIYLPTRYGTGSGIVSASNSSSLPDDGSPSVILGEDQ